MLNHMIRAGLPIVLFATGAAFGQTLDVNLYAEQDGVLIGPGETAFYGANETVHFVMLAEFTGGPDAYFGLAEIDLSPDSDVPGMTANFVPGTWVQNIPAPVLDGPDMLNMVESQRALVGPVDTSNPLLVCEFDLVPFGGAALFTYQASAAGDPAFAVYPDSGLFTLPVEFGVEAFHSVQIFMGNGGGDQPCNPADLTSPFGVLDLEDLQLFVNFFIGGDPRADLAEPFGVLDLADLFAFVDSFLAGCP